jgi:hypothetical protein
MVKSRELLRSLRNVGWNIAHRTYGSSHATWIGLLADWWIRLRPLSHTVLDGAPSFGRGRVGQGDALFCESDRPVGVLEVEGSEPEKKLWTIEQYFKSRRPELQAIQFGILAVYSYTPQGVGSDRDFPLAESAAVMRAAQKMSTRCPDRSLVVLALDKRFSRYEGVRGTSEYYSGTLCHVTGVLLVAGKERARRTLFSALDG